MRPAPPLIQTLLMDIVVQYNTCGKDVRAVECTTHKCGVEEPLFSKQYPDNISCTEKIGIYQLTTDHHSNWRNTNDTGACHTCSYS
ncbi:hypothetical protein EMCRGX_G028996 [Ephydatia muelleri]